MKTRSPFLRRSIFWVAVALYVLNAATVIAQTNVSTTEEKILPPSGETFTEAGDLVSPWRDSGCHAGNIGYAIDEPNCHWATMQQYKAADTLTLYNADGTPWYRFSLTYAKSDYFMKNKKMDFVPFSTGSDPFEPNIVILRMVGESPHWYEVETNEKTQATKFILKNDPMWKKTTWDYWLSWGNLKVDPAEVKLLDKPDGKIIEEATNWTAERGVKLLKTDGDWAYVTTVLGGSYKGWIRWRKGRDLLVGFILTAFKIPQVKTDDQNASILKEN